MKFIIAQMRLIRLPNLFTAISNIWAGSVIAGLGSPAYYNVVIGSVASAVLYAGGVTLNDYCDRERDKLTKPGRPIPAGSVSAKSTLILAISRLAIGVLLGFFISPYAGIICLSIAICAVIYDTLKSVFTPVIVFMPLCRGFNWLLGLTIGGATDNRLLIIPAGIFLYTGLLTVISQFEDKTPAVKRLVKLGIVIIPLIDGVITIAFGYHWQGLVICSLIIPMIVLGKIFEMT